MKKLTEDEIDDEAVETLAAIERKWPNTRCDLPTYRRFLTSLHGEIRERISQLDEEIG